MRVRDALFCAVVFLRANIRVFPVSKDDTGQGFWLEETFKQFPGGRKLLEIDDFSSMVGGFHPKKGAEKWQNRRML